MADQRSINMVVLTGHVLNDAELAHIPSIERDIAKFGIATNEWSKKRGETSEYHDCEAWGIQAERAEKYVKRGNLVTIIGKLKHSKWEDKDGNKRKRSYVLVESITPLVDKQKQRDSRGPGDTDDMFPGSLPDDEV